MSCWTPTGMWRALAAEGSSSSDERRAEVESAGFWALPAEAWGAG